MKQIFIAPSFHQLEKVFITNIKHLKARDPLYPLLLLVPGKLLKKYLEQKITKELTGIINIRFFTMDELAENIRLTYENRVSFYLMPVIQKIVIREIAKSIVQPDGYLFPLLNSQNFATTITDTINELKKSGITPLEFEKFAEFKQDRKIKEIAQIFNEYDQQLKTKKLYDTQDLLIYASDLLDKNNYFESTPVFIYGFENFSYIEEQFLKKLFFRMHVFAFFPYINIPIYLPIKKTIQWFISNGFRAKNVSLAKNRNVSNLVRIKNALFNLNIQSRYSASMIDESLEIASVFDKYQELQLIGQKIFNQVRGKNYFSDIAVVLPNTEKYLNHTKDILRSLKIPFHIENKFLFETKEARFFIYLLELFINNFSKEAILQIINSPQINPGVFLRDQTIKYFMPVEWNRLILKLGIIKGLNQWKQKLDTFIILILEQENSKNFKASINSLWQSSQERHQWLLIAQGMLEFVKFLHSCHKCLNNSDNRLSIIDKLFIFYDKLSLNSKIKPKIKSRLLELKKLENIGIMLNVENILQITTQLFQDSPMNNESLGNISGVVLSDLKGIIGIPFYFLLIPGLVERDLPCSIKQNPLLLDQEKVEIFRYMKSRKRDVNFSRETLSMQRLLFHLILTSTLEKLFLSFPKLEDSNKQEQNVSPFLLEIVKILSDRKANVLSKSIFVKNYPDQFYLNCQTPEILNPLFGDLFLLQRSFKCDKEAFELLVKMYPIFFAASKNTKIRWQSNTFTLFDGIIEKDGLKTTLKEYYSPRYHDSIKPKILELYALCPAKFFMQYVLNLPFIEKTPIINLMSSFIQKKVVIEILARIFDLKNIEYDRELLRELAQQTFENQIVETEELIWEIEQERLLENIEYYLETKIKNNGTSLPAYFKFNYGENKEKAPCLKLQNSDLIHFCGFFDQLNINEQEKLCEGIHYKIEKKRSLPRDDCFYSGKQISLAIDLLALEKIFPDHKILRSVYKYINKVGHLEETSFYYDKLEENMETLQKICDSVVHGIENGFFFFVPKNDKCSYCPFIEICGVYKDHLYDLKKNDSRMKFYNEL